MKAKKKAYSYGDGGKIRRADKNVSKAAEAAKRMGSEDLKEAKKNFRVMAKKSAKAAKLYNKAGADVSVSDVMNKAVYGSKK